MISFMTKAEQSRLRQQYLDEYNDTVKEYGIEPVPPGPFVLVKVVDPEEKTKGGIILNIDDRDMQAMKVGMVIGFGPTALAGYELPGGKITDGPESYGIRIGDFIEYDRHMGRLSSYKQFSTYRILAADDLNMVYREVK